MLKLTLNDPELEGYFNNSANEVESALKYIVKNNIEFNQDASHNLQEFRALLERNKNVPTTLSASIDVNELIDEINDVVL